MELPSTVPMQANYSDRYIFYRANIFLSDNIAIYWFFWANLVEYSLQVSDLNSVTTHPFINLAVINVSLTLMKRIQE